MHRFIPPFFLQAESSQPLTLYPQDDPEDFVADHVLDILREPSEDEPLGTHICAGQLRYHHLKLGAAVDLQRGWLPIFETLPAELSSLYASLFTNWRDLSGYPCFRAALVEATDTPPTSSDILVFRADGIPVSDLGLAALETVLRHGPSGLAIVYIPGLTADTKSAPHKEARLQMNNLRRLGFRRIPGAPFAILNLCVRHPTILYSVPRLSY